jgi:hypothetical protein
VGSLTASGLPTAHHQPLRTLHFHSASLEPYQSLHLCCVNAPSCASSYSPTCHSYSASLNSFRKLPLLGGSVSRSPAAYVPCCAGLLDRVLWIKAARIGEGSTILSPLEHQNISSCSAYIKTYRPLLRSLHSLRLQRTALASSTRSSLTTYSSLPTSFRLSRPALPSRPIHPRVPCSDRTHQESHKLKQHNVFAQDYALYALLQHQPENSRRSSRGRSWRLQLRRGPLPLRHHADLGKQRPASQARGAVAKTLARLTHASRCACSGCPWAIA